jgi:hypothetical protein
LFTAVDRSFKDGWTRKKKEPERAVRIKMQAIFGNRRGDVNRKI